jgi:hypothetical protein
MSPKEQDTLPFEVHHSPESPVDNMRKAFAQRRNKMGRNPNQQRS